MICFPMPVARPKLSKLGMAPLICLLFPLLVPASENTRPVTVGVFGLFRPTRIDIVTGQDTIVAILNRSTKIRRVLAGGQRLKVENHKERLKVSLFELDGSLLLAYGADAVRTEETNFTLSVPGRIQRDFFGQVEVIMRRGVLVPRVTVEEESAVLQILRSEMSDGRQMEALKAQAIIVRTYLQTSPGRHRSEGIDFCDTTHCQFFADVAAVGDRFSQAATATRGLVLTFLGKPFQPLYTAACGGQTLAGFTGSNRAERGSGYSYRSVSCNFCADHPLFHWSTTVDMQPLLGVLRREFPRDDPADILARLTQTGEGGDLGALKEATRLSVGRTVGWNVIRSNRYSLEILSNSIRIRGHGSGHNFGLCQAGAIQLARQGKSMREILSFYFPGCSIER